MLELCGLLAAVEPLVESLNLELEYGAVVCCCVDGINEQLWLYRK